MFTENTTLLEMQDTIWEFYKDVYGTRPRHLIVQDWNSREFLQAQYDSLWQVIERRRSEENIADGWESESESESEFFDAEDDGEALASAGWGTDEDYGGNCETM